MTKRLTPLDLTLQTREFSGRGGVSAESQSYGFIPAYQDAESGCVFLSRFGDGRLAPVHILEGLPADAVLKRDAAGRVLAVKGSLVPGFVRGGRFYTREQAAALVREDEPEEGPLPCAGMAK